MGGDQRTGLSAPRSRDLGSSSAVFRCCPSSGGDPSSPPRARMLRQRLTPPASTLTARAAPRHRIQRLGVGVVSLRLFILFL